MNVDLVVVSYRSGDLVRGAIDAARRFCPSITSVTVIENGTESKPDLPEGVAIVMSNSNVGYAAAVNRGARTGEAELLWLLNPDVTHFRGDFGNIASAFGGRVASVSPKLVNPDGQVEFSCRRRLTVLDILLDDIGAAVRWPHWRRAKRFRMLDWDHNGKREVSSMTGACLFVRRQAWREVGEFDEAYFVYAEEMDWMQRCVDADWQNVFEPAVQAVHLAGKSTDEDDHVRSLLLLEAMYIYCNKHCPRRRVVGLQLSMLALDLVRFVRLTKRGRSCSEREYRRKRLGIHLGRARVRPA